MTTVIDDYSPVYLGDTEVPFAPQFFHADGSLFNLTGATISMRMVALDPINQGLVKLCSGTWTIDDAVNGKAHYQWQAADVSTVGNWNLYVTITISGQPVHADPKPLVIQPAP